MLRSIACAAVFVLAFFSFGAGFQGDNAKTIFSIPTLWLFILVVLPLFLFLLVKVFWRRFDRTSR